MSTAGQALGGGIGGAVGFFVGGPMGAMYGAQIGMSIGGMLDPPKGPTMEGPRLSDLSVQTSTYGAAIPRVYGAIAVSGNMFWLENNKLKEVAVETEEGGKGGGSSVTSINYEYYATFAVGLCEGPILGVRRIWVGTDLIYDAGATSLLSIMASNKASSLFSIYLGDDTQLPDTRMQADLGVANCPAYRGLAYVVVKDLPLAKYGNALPAATLKVEVLQSAGYVVPSYVEPNGFTTSANARICYADSNVIQTAEAFTGQLVVDPELGDMYEGHIEFKTYTLDYRLIQTETQRPRIVMQGTTSLAFYKSLYITGEKSRGFAYRASGTPETTLFPGISVSPMNNLSQGGSINKAYARGYYWLMAVFSNLRLNGGGCTEYVVSGADSQSVIVVEDLSTGRCYRRFNKTFDNSHHIDEFDPDTLAVIWTQQLGPNSSFATFTNFTVDNGVATMFAFGKIAAYDVSGSSAVLLGDATAGLNDGRIYPHAPGFSSTWHSGGTSAAWLTVQRQSENAVLLADIVESEIIRSGLLSLSDIDTSALTDQFAGYKVSNIGSIRQAIEPLKVTSPFDIIQSGFKLKCVPRGGASVTSATIGDLGLSEQLRQAREMETQIPTKLVINYIDFARNYDLNQQTWERPATQAVNTRTLELPIVMTASRAAQTVEILGNMYWLERTDFGPFTLPPTFADIEPCDVITLDAGYAIYDLRITSINYKSDGSIECSAKLNSPSTYISTSVADEVPDESVAGSQGVSVAMLLDIPLVNESVQNTPGFVATMAGYSPNWRSATLVRSPDLGQTWQAVQGFTKKGTFGFARGKLNTHEGNLVDTGSTLTVDLFNGTLSGVTESQMLNGANICAYGADGRWEIMRFTNATLNADGSYTISGFWRGDFGTEWATGLHDENDNLVLLSEVTNSFINMPTEAIGVARTYRAITSGESVDTGVDIPQTYNGVNLECLSPVHASAVRSAGDIALKWKRRTRVGWAWRDYVDAQLGETTEAYEIDVMDGATVKRTITATTQTATYTSAQQVTDFGSAQSSVTFRIYQLSSVVGRGYPLETTL